MLVVGAGPSGLSAAYHLTRLGHSVTIKDAGAAAGGMMRYGIPKYRLPRDVLDAEINRILDMGVTLDLNAKVTDILAELAPGAGGRAAPGLWRMARWNRPAAAGAVSSREIEAEPAEKPNAVTRDGSPPKAATFSRTQARAASWSSRP